MRTAASTGVTKTLPSPMDPVRAEAAIASTTLFTSPSGTTSSTLILGKKSMVYSEPRYSSVWPFWRPKPRTSETVIPTTPMSVRVSFTSSSLKGLMMASIFFMGPPWSSGRSLPARCNASATYPASARDTQPCRGVDGKASPAQRGPGRRAYRVGTCPGKTQRRGGVLPSGLVQPIGPAQRVQGEDAPGQRLVLLDVEPVDVQGRVGEEIDQHREVTGLPRRDIERPEAR